MLKQMVRDRVKPDLKTFTQLLDSLPSDTQAEEVSTHTKAPQRTQND